MSLSLSAFLCVSLGLPSALGVCLSELSESLRVCGERQCWYARISVLASLTCGWLTYSVSISVYECLSESLARAWGYKKTEESGKRSERVSVSVSVSLQSTPKRELH